MTGWPLTFDLSPDPLIVDFLEHFIDLRKISQNLEKLASLKKFKNLKKKVHKLQKKKFTAWKISEFEKSSKIKKITKFGSVHEFEKSSQEFGK